MKRHFTQYVDSISFDTFRRFSAERATNTRSILALANSYANAFQIPDDAHVINAYDI